MIEDENQETRESPALSPEEVSFTREDAESVGDPAAAGAGAEGDPGSAPVEAPGAGETAATATTGTPPEDAPAAGIPPAGSPAAAQQRAESGDESPLQRPEVQILGAFVGAFALAKLLQRLFGRD
ncbi:MAG TPA: hypothetical protein VF712_14710 [Thermoleophilaceae bacterium]